MGIIGVTTTATKYTSVGGALVDFIDPVEAVRWEVASLLSRGVDVIILLSHLGEIEND